MTEQAQARLELGYERAEIGTESVIAHNFEYAASVKKFVEELPHGSSVDAEYVRSVCGDPPHPNLLGAVMRSLSKQSVIVKNGYKPSSRPKRHGAEIRCYRRS